MNTRRNFLQKLTGSLIALPLLSKKDYLESLNEIKSKKYDGPILRVAIMGLGSYGTRVADAMKDCTKAKLVGVISGTPSKITVNCGPCDSPAVIYLISLTPLLFFCTKKSKKSIKKV